MYVPRTWSGPRSGSSARQVAARLTASVAAGESQNALHTAAAHGHAGVVGPMLMMGGDVNEMVGGRTAMHVACAAGHANVVAALLQHGASITIADSAGRTPLSLAEEGTLCPLLRPCRSRRPL